ncbi:hypothetical protein EV121DRAFT_207000 [Schizophyllum commune]
MPRSFMESLESFAAETGARFEIDERLADVEAGPARIIFVARTASVHASMLHDVEVTVRDVTGATLARHRLSAGAAFLKVNIASVPGPVIIGVWQTSGSVVEMIEIPRRGIRARFGSEEKADGVAANALRIRPQDKGALQVLHTLLAGITASLHAMMTFPEQAWDWEICPEPSNGRGQTTGMGARARGLPVV